MSASSFWILLALVERSFEFLLMLTLLSFFLGVLPSFSVCWLEDEDDEELVLALESSSDIANPPPHPANGPSLCVWLLRAAAAAAAAAATGPGHSCLALTGREAEVQQQQLLTRQWLPRPHTLRATPPLRPAPRPSPAGPAARLSAPAPQGASGCRRRPGGERRASWRGQRRQAASVTCDWWLAIQLFILTSMHCQWVMSCVVTSWFKWE